MKTKKKKYSKEITDIRISTEELIELLEKYCKSYSVTASAENDHYEFESIDDMRAHQSLLAGAPTIKVGVTYIHFRSHGSSVGYYCHDPSDESEFQSEAIATELTSYKSIIRAFVRYLKIGGYFCLIMFAIYTVATVIKPEVEDWFGQGFGFLLALVVLPLVLVTDWLSRRLSEPVFHNTRESFWRRNQDKVLVGLLMLIFGILATKITDWILDRNF